MPLTNYPNGLSSFGIPVVGGGGVPTTLGLYYFVDANGGAANIVLGQDNAFLTVQAAINAALLAGNHPATIILAPGSYDEAVTIPRTSSISRARITLYGAGPKGSVAIHPTATNAVALTNDCDDVTLINVGLNTNGTGKALVNTGSRLRMFGCKLENDDGTGECAQMTLQTVAQRTAGTKGNGADCLLYGCEFAWAASGIEIVCTDEGAVTELQIVDCWFHDLDTKHIYETVGSGGAAGVMYASLRLQGNIHQTDEAGTAPTDYVLLNGDNANSGIMTGCAFPEAINAGKVLLSTKLIAVGCFFTGGINAAQPS